MSWRPQSFLLTAARIRTAVPWYSRRHAQSYEAKRQGLVWRDETEAFRELFDRVRPEAVLDAPVGTGRWFDLYHEHGARVLGVDLSPDMLDQAARKIPTAATGSAVVRLQRADLLNPAPGALGRDHDLVVCTRFTHWLRPPDVAALGRHFAATGARHLIIGGRVNPEAHRARSGAGNGHWRQWLKQLASRKRLTSRVHDETAFLAALEAGGWRLLDKRLVRTTAWFRYYFYLFEAG